MAVFKRTNRTGHFRLVELAPGVTIEQLRQSTEADFDA
jgi:acyl CoA:acetate/3-ketoacid CoA transferase beta subunit